MKAVLFLVIGFFVIFTVYREGKKKVVWDPLEEARETGERMRQGDDAVQTLSKKWAKLCRMHGAQPESVPSDNKELEYARQELVYAACGVWRDPYVIDVVASRLPGLFKNWQTSTL